MRYRGFTTFLQSPCRRQHCGRNGRIWNDILPSIGQSVVSVHDITLNTVGLGFALQSMADMCRQVGIRFYPLKVGQTMSL